MAFDATKPANNSPVSSAEMRAQLVALKALIDAKPDQNTVLQEISNNTAGSFNAVEYPNFTISNPPTQPEVQALFDLVVAILDAGRRA